MREERGTIAGDYTVSDELTLWGTVGGNLIVAERGKFYMRGAVYGDILVEYGGRLHIFGRVVGSLTVKRGGKGHPQRRPRRRRHQHGRPALHRKHSQINGKIKTVKGETQIRSCWAAAHRRRAIDDHNHTCHPEGSYAT